MSLSYDCPWGGLFGVAVLNVLLHTSLSCSPAEFLRWSLALSLFYRSTHAVLVQAKVVEESERYGYDVSYVGMISRVGWRIGAWEYVKV
jgi:hypothetical protein